MKLKPLKVWKSLNLTKILRKQKFWKLNFKINSYLVIHTKSYKMEDVLLKQLGNYST